MKRSLRIMILDDERIVCDRLRPALEKLGHHVEALTSSEAAITRIAEQRYDVLVTDLKMPGLGGMAVLSHVREECPNTKVIVITGFATAEMARQVLQEGAVEFIPKPFRMSYLRDLIVKIAEEAPGPAGHRGADGNGER
jgi:DNA-binding NtrC family response regulator